MRDLEFLTGHVTFKLRYNQIWSLKTTLGNLQPNVFVKLRGYVEKVAYRVPLQLKS